MRTDPPPNKDQAILARLARIMLQRHIRTSLPTSKFRRKYFSSKFARECDVAPRVIAVVGAGASWPEIALANELAAELLGQHERDPGALRMALARTLRLPRKRLPPPTGRT